MKLSIQSSTNVQSSMFNFKEKLKGISLNNKPVIYDKSLRKKKQLSECIKPNLRWHEGEKERERKKTQTYPDGIYILGAPG